LNFNNIYLILSQLLFNDAFLLIFSHLEIEKDQTDFLELVFSPPRLNIYHPFLD